MMHLRWAQHKLLSALQVAGLCTVLYNPIPDAGMDLRIFPLFFLWM